MQYSASIETIEAINKLIESGSDSEDIDVVADAFGDVSTSNQSFFNILLAVFAAWVGAVVAFYFGSENLQQAQQTLEKVALSAKQELAKKTIEELLAELKEAKNVKKSKMNHTVLQVRKELQTMSNVLVVDDNDEPLGVLYRMDLEKYPDIDIDDEKDPNDDNKLSEIIEKITEDYITKKPWSKEKGINNYAILSLKDNLLLAKEKMEEIAGSVDHLLSVRGIVLDKESKVIAIINFANLTKGIV